VKTLRDYQRAAVDAAYTFCSERPTENPCVVLPTGAGKSMVIATLCREAVEHGADVIVLAHVKELLQQISDHLLAVDPLLPVGIYSAGLGEKDPDKPVVVAGIQSAYRAPERFRPPGLIIIDEAHRIPIEGEGMYRTFLAAQRERNPEVRMIGLTATPYRTGSGLICSPSNILNAVAYEAQVRELTERGYLSKLCYRGPMKQIDFSNLHVRQGEFIPEEVAAIMEDDEVTVQALIDLLGAAESRKSVLVFASGIKHGKNIATLIRENDPYMAGVAEVYGDTPDDERARAIADFRAGRLKYLVNVDVLTMGFDAPGVDCVALLRPTYSEALWYQMVGRGLRIAEGKKDCLVMDFGGNAERHGPIEDLSKRITKSLKPGDAGDPENPGEGPMKQCRECFAMCAIACKVCPACGKLFPVKIKSTAFRDVQEGVPRDLTVLNVTYGKHVKFLEPEKPPSLRVDYHVAEEAGKISEWVCLQHGGYALEKALGWWRQRAGTAPPRSVDDAMERLEEIRPPARIRVIREGKYDRVTAVKMNQVIA
jgi:DNA repair protein RadD